MDTAKSEKEGGKTLPKLKLKAVNFVSFSQIQSSLGGSGEYVNTMTTNINRTAFHNFNINLYLFVIGDKAP